MLSKIGFSVGAQQHNQENLIFGPTLVITR